MNTGITTTYLEIRDPADLRPARDPRVPFALDRAEPPDPELNRSMYTAIGSDWSWRDRLSWDDARWLKYLGRPELETWVASVDGTPAGYFELELQGDSVEIAYFGLLPAFIGQGLGGALLTQAIRRGFEMGAARVWLHTCTLDHPQALANYLARGMRVFRTTTG
jgi:ribosomal protein S18 acetylase RimI-like enzyme